MPLHLVLGPANARKVGALLDAHERASQAGRTAWFVVPRSSDVGPMRRELAGSGGPPGQPPRRATPFGRVMVGRTLEDSLLKALGTGGTLLSSDHRRAVALAAIRAQAASSAAPLKALLPAARSGWLHAQLIDVAEELATTGDLGGRAGEVLRAWSAATGDGRGRELADLLAADAAILRRLAAHAVPRIDRAAAARLLAARLSAAPDALGDLHVAVSGFDDLDAVQRAVVVALGRSRADVVLSLPYQPGREALIAPRGLVEFLRTAVPDLKEPALPADAGAASPHPSLARIEQRLYEQVVFEAPLAAQEPDPFGPLVPFDEPDDPVADESPGVPAAASPGSDHPTDAPVEPAPTPAVVELRGGGPDEEAALIAQHVAAAIDRGVPAERIAVAVGEPARQGPSIAAAITRAGLPAYLGAARPASASPSIAALLGLLGAADVGGTPRELVDWLAGPGAPGGLGGADALDAMARRRGASSAAEAYRMWKYLGHAELAEFDELIALRRQTGPADRPAAFERAIGAALRTRAAAAMREPSAHGAGLQRDLRVVAKVVSVVDDLVAMIEAEPDRAVQDGLSLGLGELRELIAQVPSPLDEQPAGSIAIVGPLDVRSRYVDVLVIARAQAGSYPATEPVRRILTPRDRAALSLLGWPTPTRPEHASGERYLAYEVVARPTQQLILAWHDGDGDGKPCEPSPLLAEVRRATGHDVPTFSMPSGSSARHAHGDDRLARIKAARNGPRHRERSPDQSPVLAAQERDRYAVGALQTASRCPAQWFVDHHLRPKPLSPDAAPLTAGRLRHEVLAEVVGRVVQGEGRKLSPDALPALREALAAAAARLAPTGTFDPEAAQPGRRATETLAERLMRERVVAEIDATLPALCGTEQLEHQPAELELAFGTTPRGVSADDPMAAASGARDDEADDLRPPVTIERAGETLVLAGRIDRLDVSTSGELVVVDYKGANVDPYKGQGWVENRELQAGLYALAAEQLMGGGTHAVASLYQPVPGPVGQAPRGATSEPLPERGPMSRNDRLDPETWDELLDALVQLAGDAQRSIDDGLIAPDPTRCSPGGCRYPWLCREVQA